MNAATWSVAPKIHPPTCRSEAARLITVALGLVGSLLGHSDVVCLLLREEGQLSSQLVQMQAGDLLIQVLGQHVHLAGLVLLGVLLGPQLDLSEGLVGERRRHDKRRVASGAAQVEQAALGEEDDAVSIGEQEAVHLGLDVLALHAGECLEAEGVDLVVEMADVTNNGVVLHLGHQVNGEDVLVAGGSDEDVDVSDDLLHADDLEALHARLQGADGVSLGHVHDASSGLECLGAALTDIAEASDNRALASKHDVSGAHDAVGQAVLAAVQVVELGLGHRVVDVDGGEQKLAGLGHVVKTVHAGGGLLGHTLAAGGQLVPLLRVLIQAAAHDGIHQLQLGVGGACRVGLGAVLGEDVLGLESLVDQQGHVTAIILQ